jgi:hypothetical protein
MPKEAYEGSGGAAAAKLEADERLRERGVALWLAALTPEALELVRCTPLAERLGRERMYLTVEQAVAAFESQPPREGVGSA